jgi:FAD/FMN-containing dehydrogenase
MSHYAFLQMTANRRGEFMDVHKTSLMEIVGTNSVLDSPQLLAEYSKDQSFARPMNPRLVITPKNVDEVQKIVQWANATNTPLVPVSSGMPHLHGDTVPGVPEAVILDLSGMKQIRSINRRYRIAVIEPGVTYSELQPALAREGLRLSTPLAPRENKSVVASLLEVEPRLNPRYQWSYVDPLRCLEVVWGDGNRMMTGEAGMAPPSLEQQWKAGKRQISAYGPTNLDFYRFVTRAQGSMGIVTWASVKCEILPRIQKLYFAPASKPDDLLAFVYRLLRFRFGDQLMIMNSACLAGLLGRSAAHARQLQENLPRWVALVGIAGREMLPEERVEFQEKDIADIAQAHGLQLVPALPGVSGVTALETVLNPSPLPYWKARYKGAWQEILFVATLDRSPEFISTMYGAAERAGLPTSDIGVYLQPQHQGASCHCEFILPYDPENQRERLGMQELYVQASEQLLRQGAFFTRPYGIWAPMAFTKDAAAANALKTIKRIFDPNNIMNPGKLF